MIPTPDRVTKGPRHWWLWFVDRKAEPGVTRWFTLVTVARDGRDG